MTFVPKGAAWGPLRGPLPRPLAIGGSWRSLQAQLSLPLVVLVYLAASTATAEAADSDGGPAPATRTLARLPVRSGSAPPAPSRESLISRADRALHDRRYTAAAELYRRAAAMDPSADDAPRMAAVAAFLEQYGRTRRELARAMSRDLSPEDRDLGRIYLELQDDADGASATDSDDSFGTDLRTTLGGGFDNNPHRSGAAAVSSEVFTGLRPDAAFGIATIEAALYGSTHPGFEIELDYTLEQIAYSDRRLADLAYLDQGLELGMAQALGSRARLLVTLSAELSQSGVGTRLTPFSRAVRADGELILGTGMVQLRLGGGYQTIDVSDRDLAFLSGRRQEVRATPVLDAGGWRASLTAGLRADTLGNDRGEPTEADLPICVETCTTLAVIPHSNRAAVLSARLTTPWRWRLRPGLWARAERRSYDPATLEESSNGDTAIRYTVLGSRASTTMGIGATLRLRLSQRVSLTARWDYTRFDAVFRPASAAACAGHEECGQGSLTDRRYQKQSLGLQVEIEWL